MADAPVSREADLPDGDVVAKWTFIPTIIGAILFIAVVFIFIL